MGEPNILTILRAKRSRLAGEVDELNKRIAEHQKNLDHVDGVLRMYGDIDPEAIPTTRVRRTRFKRRELPVLVHSIMETGIIKNRHIATEICRRKGWDATDDELRRKLAACVSKAKHALRRKSPR